MSSEKIFFSYSRTDGSDFTLRLALDLKKAGFNVWIDQQDIRAGTEWDIEIEKALETCDCLLFIETENSVTSNNVLDEVYYALEQRKRVIPVIYHDSKTPFRLQRLQHIDFTKEYETGLGNLIRELKKAATSEVFETSDDRDVRPAPKTFFAKYSRLFLIISFLLVLAVVTTIIYSTNNKKEIQQTESKAAITNDTFTNEHPQSEIAEPMVSVKNEEIKNEKKASGNTGSKTTKPGNNKITPLLDNSIENLVETFAGNWELAGVEPKARLQSGYLKIEAIDERKVKILSNFQFYFFRTKAAAQFTVFNGFASCESCVLKTEIKIIDKDIAFGSNKVEVLKADDPEKGKAGDTVLNAGGNNTISALVTLRLVNSNSVVILVQQSQPTLVGNDLVVEPFDYTFRFRKKL